LETEGPARSPQGKLPGRLASRPQGEILDFEIFTGKKQMDAQPESSKLWWAGEVEGLTRLPSRLVLPEEILGRRSHVPAAGLQRA